MSAPANEFPRGMKAVRKRVLRRLPFPYHRQRLALPSPPPRKASPSIAPPTATSRSLALPLFNYRPSQHVVLSYSPRLWPLLQDMGPRPPTIRSTTNRRPTEHPCANTPETMTMPVATLVPSR